jgi:hypothetical protein
MGFLGLKAGEVYNEILVLDNYPAGSRTEHSPLDYPLIYTLDDRTTLIAGGTKR